MKRLLAITALSSATIHGFAIAQDEAQQGNRDAVLELTMTLIPSNAKTSAAVTAIIELPKEPSSGDIPSTQGVGQSARGLDTADNLAREEGRAFGAAAAAAARDNREAASRASHDVGNQPAPAIPEPPDRPDLPSR